MPTSATLSSCRDEPPVLSWTVERYHRLVETGILGEDQRTELIEGRILAVSPPSGRHAGRLRALIDLLGRRVAGRALLDAQNPLELDQASEPQPDLMLLAPRADYYASRHPRATDALLVVEVMLSSARYDREVKLPLYARAGVGEVWLIDVDSGTVEAYTEPGPHGYARRRAIDARGSLAPTALPDVILTGSELLGPTS